jgi:hypothetical protein
MSKVNTFNNAITNKSKHIINFVGVTINHNTTKTNFWELINLDKIN